MSSFTSKTESYSSSTKRKEAFSQELSATLGKRGLVTSSEEVNITTTQISSLLAQLLEEQAGVRQELLGHLKNIKNLTISS